MFFFPYSFSTRQIPGLPRSTAAGKVKRGKKNITGIEGRIMNPIARAEAQRRQLAAKRVSEVALSYDVRQNRS